MVSIVRRRTNITQLPEPALIKQCQDTLGSSAVLLPSQNNGDKKSELSLAPDSSAAAQTEEAPKKVATLGDVHGNTLNLIHKLLALKVLEPPKGGEEECYQKLNEAYKTLATTKEPSNPEGSYLASDRYDHETDEDFQKRNAKYQKKKAQYLRDEKEYGPRIREAVTLFLSALDEMSCQSIIDLNLIGDLVGDRGANDYLSFKVLEKLSKAGVRYTINISNHDSGFMYEYELFRKNKRVPKGYSERAAINHQSQMTSSNNLFHFFEKNILDKEEVNTLYETVYRNHLVLFDVSFDTQNESLNITSHAPITIMSVFAAAEKFNIPADTVAKAEKSLDGFVAMIAMINQTFAADISSGTAASNKTREREHGIISPNALDYYAGRCEAGIASNVKTALAQPIWNRNILTEEREEHKCTVAKLSKAMGIKEITFTYGHVGPEQSARGLRCEPWRAEGAGE